MTPEPLMALVREWAHEYGYGGRQDKFGHLKACRRCAVEATLKAWAEQLPGIIEQHMPLESVAGEPGDAGCSCGAKLAEYTWCGYCKHLAACVLGVEEK